MRERITTTADKLRRLADLTGVPLDELRDPSPNMEAIRLLGEDLDWFRREFLMLPALQHAREGKLPADLLVKALRKVLSRIPGSAPYRI